MREQPWPVNYERRHLTRRKVTRSIGALGLAVLTAGAGNRAYPPVKEAAMRAFERRFSVNSDYSDQPFYKELGAHGIDRNQLDDLLGPNTDIPVELHQVTKEAQADREALAEYHLTLERDGPVFAEFTSLHGNNDSLIILRASIDHGDQFLVPILRTTAEDRPAVTVQLGAHEKGSHTLELYEAYATVPVAAEEVAPSVTQGTIGTVRSVLDMYQPDLYLHDYGNIANNFPWRSYAAVSETDEGLLAVVYVTECLDEDRVFGLIGTTPQQLIATKGRPTDSDWVQEAAITQDGSVTLVNIDAVYHTRRELPSGQVNREHSHLPLLLASPNNNVEVVTDPSLLRRAKLRLRPIPITDSERYHRAHTTDTSAALLSLCENIREGSIDPNNPKDAAILRHYLLNVNDCSKN